jgi:protein-S-isoprenylcysteine O-methyltransferase Ste14
MYLAAILIYLAAAIAVDSVIALVCLMPPLITLHYSVIVREERYLEETFVITISPTKKASTVE